jgi:predicted RNA-binding Zn ribbon-like protein
MTLSERAHAELLVDLINTRYLGDQSDVLAQAGAAQWLRDHVGQKPRHRTAGALAPVRHLREGLRQMAIANNGGQPDAATVEQAETALRRATILVGLDRGAGVPAAYPTAPDGTVERILATVAVAYLSSRIGGGWRRVKACAEPDCRWAFLDLSRNGSRRWCDMNECGNRAKNRAWRTRQSGRARQATVDRLAAPDPRPNRKS